MSSNNPRKKREAEKARAGASTPLTGPEGSGDLSRADDITVMVGDSAGADAVAPVPAAAEAGAAGDVGAQAKAAADALQAKAAAAAAEANAPSAAAEEETVSFTSATELLNQTQQQIKKAKSEAARQKRAKEMEEAQKKARKRKLRRRIILAFIGLLIVALCALALVFCAERWWLHDDEYDIQGTWQVAGTDTEVTITEDSIVLTDEVAYRYDINPDDKTITFNFGTLAGEGHYRFSLDRDQLSITDGTVEDASNNLIEDIGWWINASLSQLFGSQLTPTIDGSALALERA